MFSSSTPGRRLQYRVCVAFLEPLEILRAWTLVRRLDLEFDFLPLLEVWTADILHMEEDVLLRIVALDKSVAASVVEERNLAFRHCNWRVLNYLDKPCVYRLRRRGILISRSAQGRVMSRTDGATDMWRLRVRRLLRPHRFFEAVVTANDQAPAVYHIIIIGSITAAVRLWVGPIPSVGGSALIGAAVWIALTGLFIAPIALHLAAALATVMLMITVPERAGISMTVQVWAYAATPVVLIGLGRPALTVVAIAVAGYLTVVGTAVVHRISMRRALLAAAVPIMVVYGIGLGGFASVTRLLS